MPEATPTAIEPQSVQPPVIAHSDLRKMLKRGSKVLWVDLCQRRESGGAVEAGDVQFVNSDTVDLIWLEGYKSRNDTVKIDEILAIFDPKSKQEVSICVFSGRGHITQAGIERLIAHPDERRNQADS